MKECIVQKLNPLFLSIHTSMASLILKPKRLRNNLLRVLSFAALLLALKHALFLSLAGDNALCVYPEKNHIFFGCLRPQPPPSGHRRRRDAVDYYSSVFQDLISQGFLSLHSRSLCLETLPGDGVVAAMKEIGISDSVAVSGGGGGGEYRQWFDSDAFDFEFAAEGRLEKAARPDEIASEIGRTLKPGGFLVAHTSSAQDSYSLNSFLELFECCRLISAGEIDGLDSPTVREIVMKKDHHRGPKPRSSSVCSAAGYRSQIVMNAEALIEESALKKPWIAAAAVEKDCYPRSAVKYLTTMVDISFKRRYVYVDVGSGRYGSSIGGWFARQYPKQGKEFEIFAVESDRSFHAEYSGRGQEVTLLPMAAWIRNETLFFEIARGTKKKRTNNKKVVVPGRFQPVVPTASYVLESAEVRGFDFAEWLAGAVSRRDFVVVRMDVGGAEFQLIPRMVETGAICLVDEIFLVCHYDRSKRRVRYRRTYDDCLRLFGSISERGVLVHQWW